MIYIHKLKTGKQKGFTLAEVLVTLAIIGVVAALTIPSLIAQNVRNSRIAQYKKVYAVLSQAALKVKEDLGGTIVDPPGLNWAGDPYYKDKFKIHLNYVQDLNPNVTNWKLLGDVNGKMAALDNSDFGTMLNLLGPQGNSPALVLADGTVLIFDGWRTVGGDIVTIFADLNGHKSPNIIGKDIFMFGLNANGTFELLEGAPCDTSNFGDCCGFAIMTGNYNVN